MIPTQVFDLTSFSKSQRPNSAYHFLCALAWHILLYICTSSSAALTFQISVRCDSLIEHQEAKPEYTNSAIYPELKCLDHHQIFIMGSSSKDT
jgi:hypothetical protein